MEIKRTLTVNWDALDNQDDDDKFFESYDRLSSISTYQSASSGSDDEHTSDTHTASSPTTSSLSTAVTDNGVDFMIASVTNHEAWLSAPLSVNERRQRLLQCMGLASSNEFMRLSRKNLSRLVSEKAMSTMEKAVEPVDHKTALCFSPVGETTVRCASDSEIDMFWLEKTRKELIGSSSKHDLIRSYSSGSMSRINPKEGLLNVNGGGLISSIISTREQDGFLVIKNLDTGKEFVVNGCDQNGMWSKLSDLQTGKQLTMDEFERCVGHSPVVKELMRRESFSVIKNGHSGVPKIGTNSYLSRSLRLSKRRGVALLKNIKCVAHSMSMVKGEKNSEQGAGFEQKSGKSFQSYGWVKVKQTGKSYKELSALHMCQEIHAHEGAIWTLKFNTDARLLASGGEDKFIHVWEVQECEVMSLHDGNLIQLQQPSGGSSPTLAEIASIPSEKKRKSTKGSHSRKNNLVPEYVHVPETVFLLSEKPVCSFSGHLEDVLDLSWSKSKLLLSSSMDKTVRLWDIQSKSCLKLFAHSDYVTCIQFNPVDDNFFISGSLDAKVRMWNIPNRKLADWADLHEMITALSYYPDGQGAIIGTHKGGCRIYDTEDNTLNLLEKLTIKSKKSSHAKKITGFHFSPANPPEILVTSADSRVRILEGTDVIHKFKGFRNVNSQICASFTSDSRCVVCASEDSQVCVWKREEARTGSAKPRAVITTRSHESFQCRDVTVAVPWTGKVRGDPPQVLIHSKRHSKRISFSQSPTCLSPAVDEASCKRNFPPSANGSPTRDEYSSSSDTRQHLPPLPKKNGYRSNSRTPISSEDETSFLLSPPDSDAHDSFRSSSVIHSSIATRNSSLGKQLHCCSLKQGIHSLVFVGSAIVDFYAKSHRVDDSKRAFDDIQNPNVVSYTALIHGFVRSGRTRDALDMFDDMPEKNVVSWNAMISALHQVGENECAINMFISMLREGVFPNETTFPSAIVAAANIAAMGVGRCFHAQVIKSFDRINTYIGNSLISFYARCGAMEDAQLVFDRLTERNLISWNVMICGLAQNGRGNEAISLFQVMKKMKIAPSDVTYLGLLWACDHSGLVEQGYDYFRQAMDDHPDHLKPEHYACMVDLLSRNGLLQEAQSFLDNLPFKPGIGFWKSLLGGCQIHSNTALSRVVTRKIQSLDAGDVSSYILLSNVHSSAQRWPVVARIRREMKEKGLKRVSGCSWIEIQNKVHVFVTCDMIHLMNANIRTTLKTMLEHLKIIHDHFIYDKFLLVIFRS